VLNKKLWQYLFRYNIDFKKSIRHLPYANMKFLLHSLPYGPSTLKVKLVVHWEEKLHILHVAENYNMTMFSLLVSSFSFPKLRSAKRSLGEYLGDLLLGVIVLSRFSMVVCKILYRLP
jgi:hypothetical protein